MKLSRIVKSAYARARRAGFRGSLKEFARRSVDAYTADSDVCEAWLANKAKQRRLPPNQRAARDRRHDRVTSQPQQQEGRWS